MTRISAGLFALALLVPTVGQAEDDETSTSPFHADFEIDPLAYVLSGHSLHVGLGYRHVRVDLGTFAIDVPDFLDSTDGFDTSISGFGAKFLVFPFAEQRGVFFGVDANLARAFIRRERSDLATRQLQFSTGVLAGARISLPAGFYVVPWIGVGYTFGADDVRLGDATYDAKTLSVFPTIHIGYQFL